MVAKPILTRLLGLLDCYRTILTFIYSPTHEFKSLDIN